MKLSTFVRIASQVARSSFVLVAAMPFASAQVHISTLADTPQSSDHFGRSLAWIGDVNNDGTRDLAVGCIDAENNFSRVKIRSGKNLTVTLADMKGDDSFPDFDDAFGFVIVDAGDLNGNGKREYLVGAPEAQVSSMPSAGRVYVREAGTNYSWKIPGAQAFEDFGTAIAVIGDVDGDAIPDFAVGAPKYNGTGTDNGRVIVFSGDNYFPLYNLTGQPNSEFGAALAGIGDMNGDNIPDFVIGAPGEDTAGTNAGAVYVKSGNNGATIWSSMGSVANGRMGASVAGPGDVDGDGYADVAFGAPGDQSGKGSVKLVRGPWGGAPKWTTIGANVNDNLGACVLAAGDLNRDGKGDLLVGATNAISNAGQVFVLHGNTGTVALTPAVGNGSGDKYGLTAAAMGDVDGDGWMELAVGAPLADIDGAMDVGEIEVVSAYLDQENFGFGGPGNASLSMRGFPLSSGNVADFRLVNAKPNAPAFLVAATTVVKMPVMGGTIVPSPFDGLLLPVMTDAQGKITIPSVPGGYGSFAEFAQVVIQDNAQVKGYAFSNALKIVFYP